MSQELISTQRNKQQIRWLMKQEDAEDAQHCEMPTPSFEDRCGPVHPRNPDDHGTTSSLVPDRRIDFSFSEEVLELSYQHRDILRAFFRQRRQRGPDLGDELKEPEEFLSDVAKLFQRALRAKTANTEKRKRSARHVLPPERLLGPLTDHRLEVHGDGFIRRQCSLCYKRFGKQMMVAHWCSKCCIHMHPRCFAAFHDPTIQSYTDCVALARES